MLRKCLPVVVVAACAVLALAAFAAEAPTPAQPTPTTAEALAPAAVADAPAAGQCLPDGALFPAPLPLAGNQTCEECQATCNQREIDCYDRCKSRGCFVDCDLHYFNCLNKCSC